MRWILGIFVLGAALVSAWHHASKRGRSAQERVLTGVATYLSPVAIAMAMAFGVDAGVTSQWPRFVKGVYVWVMLTLIMFGIGMLMLFLQSPGMRAPVERRLARNVAIGSGMFTTLIFGLRLVLGR